MRRSPRARDALAVAVMVSFVGCSSTPPRAPLGPDVELQRVEPARDLVIHPEDVSAIGALIATLPGVGDLSDMRIESVEPSGCIHLLTCGTLGAAWLTIDADDVTIDHAISFDHEGAPSTAGYRIIDIEGDGDPEFIKDDWQGFEAQIRLYDSTGALRWASPKVVIAWMLTTDVDGDGKLDIVYGDFFGPRGHGSISSPSVEPPDPWAHAVRADGTTIWDRCWGRQRDQAILLDDWPGRDPLILVVPGVPTAYGLDGAERWQSPFGGVGAQMYRKLTRPPASAPEAELQFVMVNVADLNASGMAVGFLDVEPDGVHHVWARDERDLAHDFTTGEVVRLRGIERPVFVEGNSLSKAGRGYWIRMYEDGASDPFWSERVWASDHSRVVAEGAHVIVPNEADPGDQIDLLVGWGPGLWRFRVRAGPS